MGASVCVMAEAVKPGAFSGKDGEQQLNLGVAVAKGGKPRLTCRCPSAP